MYGQGKTEEEAKEDLNYYNKSDREYDRRGASPFWYGTSAQLGFAANNFRSDFVIGLVPIVGYKINDFLSVGPRGSIIFNRSVRQQNFGDEVKFSYFTWSIGAFTRAKIYRGFFAHVEYSLYGEADSYTVNADGDVDVNRITRALPFAGGGISQGGGPGSVGFEILLLFRLTQADRINDQPFEFRTGINYNF